jgi:hypothetical protein
MALEDREQSVMTATAPKVYYTDNSPLPTNWIAEGSDGCLYMVPAEPGGWLRRDRYDACDEELNPVSPQKARTITWYVYGDVGQVTIAGASE